MGLKKAQAGMSWAGGLIVFLLIIGLLFAAYIWIMLTWSYSEGERAGWVQKLSRKGWLCKTWEGEIALVAMPGAMPEKFHFTVWDDQVAEQINQSMGQRVTLHYEQHIGLPTSCFGDTAYFVNAVKAISDSPSPMIIPSNPAQLQPAPQAPAQGQPQPTPVPVQPMPVQPPPPPPPPTSER